MISALGHGVAASARLRAALIGRYELEISRAKTKVARRKGSEVGSGLARRLDELPGDRLCFLKT